MQEDKRDCNRAVGHFWMKVETVFAFKVIIVLLLLLYIIKQFK